MRWKKKEERRRTREFNKRLEKLNAEEIFPTNYSPTKRKNPRYKSAEI